MLETISVKVDRGERLTEDDALWLFEKANLLDLGELANRVNLKKNGRAVFYNINRHINPTNICALSCKFCAYSKKLGEAGGYAYEIDEMIQKAGEAVAQGATELHMVGGLHPRWPFQRYVDMIAAMHKAYPSVHLKAFTAVELDWMARKARKTIAEVMQDLKAAGLGSFPGGGAEIFHPDIRDQICDTKVSGDQWIDTHRTAHRLGLRSNCTMLYGHIENFFHRVDHMRRLRQLQDETGGFNVFIPLAFQPFQNEMGINRYTFGSDDLRTIAVARLYLDNFKNIKSYWVMLGQDVAQLALYFGANDLDGTVLEEKISRAAGGRAGMIMTRTNLENIIRRSDRIPVERTTLYEPVHTKDLIHLNPSNLDKNDSEIVGRLGALANSHSAPVDDSWYTAVGESTIYNLTQSLRRAGKIPHRELTFESATFIIGADDGSVEKHSDRSENATAAKLLPNDASNEKPMPIVVSMAKGRALLAHKMLATFRTVSKNTPLVLQSFLSVADAAAASETSLLAILTRLKDLGLKALLECPTDATHLGHDARWDLIQTASFVGLRVVPNVILKCKEGAPNWRAWIQDLLEAKQKIGAGLTLTEFAVATDPNASIMPSEYLKAIALARLILPNSCKVWTPLQAASALSPQKGLGANDGQHPIMKLVSLLGGCGSASLGYLPSDIYSEQRVREDILASGRLPRNDLWAEAFVPPVLNLTESPLSLRHIPGSNLEFELT